MSLQDAVSRRPKDLWQIPADWPHASTDRQRGELMDVSERVQLDFRTNRTIAANTRAEAGRGCLPFGLARKSELCTSGAAVNRPFKLPIKALSHMRQSQGSVALLEQVLFSVHCLVKG